MTNKFDAITESEINDYLADLYDDANGIEPDEFPAKDRVTKAARYMLRVKARDRRSDLLTSKGYDKRICPQVCYGYKLSELGHPNPWKKYNTSSKKSRQDPTLSGKGNLYKYVNGRGGDYAIDD